MSKPQDPVRAGLALARLQGAMTTMAWQSSIVMPIRLQMMWVGMFTPGGGDPHEMTRMVTEKMAAAAAGMGAAASCALRGGDAVAVATAAIGPTRRAVRANAKRLASR